MKLSDKLATLKQRKETEAKAGEPNGGSFALPGWEWLALLLILAVGGTLAYLHFHVWTVPPELVGTWKVEEGPQSGTFTFSRNGALRVRVQGIKTDQLLKGQVEVEDRTLWTTTRHPKTGQENTSKSTIRELTAKSLILELESGDIVKLVRKR
jgi:hypothetical protein